MSAPQLHGTPRTFTASGAVDAQNRIVTQIREEDGATWTDMGRVFGKSEDRAAAYGNTASAIDLPTFLSGCREWRGRFADPLLALAGGRWVDLGSVPAQAEPGALQLATLLPAIMQVEADGVTQAQELVPHEELIRRVHMLTTHWLDMIALHRAAGAE
jgi:hypothetical protein